jgi:hypothetical protein
VLVPGCRSELDGRATGLIHKRRLAVARAVAWATESGTKVPPSLDDVSPGLVSTSVPLPWSTALAARLAETGNPIGHRIAAELLGVYRDQA